MLQPLTDLPPGVIGFEGIGELHAEDYTKVLLPALRAATEAGDDLRVVLVFESWGGLSSGALWEDLQLGIEHLTRWKRIALVTDVDWMVHVTKLFGWMTPGEMKHFPLAERAAAGEWAVGD